MYATIYRVEAATDCTEHADFHHEGHEEHEELPICAKTVIARTCTLVRDAAILVCGLCSWVGIAASGLAALLAMTGWVLLHGM